MEYDPLHPDVIADPYPYLAHLRENDPVHKVKKRDMWILTRYEDVLAAARDAKTFSSEGLMTTLMGEFEVVPETPFFLSTDPPRHTHYRRIVNQSFNARLLRSFEPTVRELVDELLDRIGEQEEFDIIDRFTVPLPILVISDIIGVERDMQGAFRRWTTDIIESQNWPMASEPPSEADKDRVRATIKEFRGYFLDQMNEVRRRPREDFISWLVKFGDQDDALNEMEMLSILTTMLLGGSETTYKFIGNMLLALFDHPQQFQLVRDDPSLTANAVEECIRFDGPSLMIPRRTTTEAAIGGKVIPAGKVVFLCWASSSRDRSRWGTDADELNVRRNCNGHLGFGVGHHFCPGAILARSESKAALEAVIRRYSSITCKKDGLVRDKSYFIRGLAKMPVVVTRAA